MIKVKTFKIQLIIILSLSQLDSYSQSGSIYQFGGHFSGYYELYKDPSIGIRQTLFYTWKINGGKLIWSSNKLDLLNKSSFFSKDLNVFAGLSTNSLISPHTTETSVMKYLELNVYPYLSIYFPYNLFINVSAGIYSSLDQIRIKNPSTIVIGEPKLVKFGPGYEVGIGYTIPVFNQAKLEPYLSYNYNWITDKYPNGSQVDENISNIHMKISIQVYIIK